jgi:hypothetical protein
MGIPMKLPFVILSRRKYEADKRTAHAANQRLADYAKRLLAEREIEPMEKLVECLVDALLVSGTSDVDSCIDFAVSLADPLNYV